MTAIPCSNQGDLAEALPHAKYLDSLEFPMLMAVDIDISLCLQVRFLQPV